jgi:hypothetical protein
MGEFYTRLAELMLNGFSEKGGLKPKRASHLLVTGKVDNEAMEEDEDTGDVEYDDHFTIKSEVSNVFVDRLTDNQKIVSALPLLGMAFIDKFCQPTGHHHPDESKKFKCGIQVAKMS